MFVLVRNSTSFLLSPQLSCRSTFRHRKATIRSPWNLLQAEQAQLFQTVFTAKVFWPSEYSGFSQKWCCIFIHLFHFSSLKLFYTTFLTFDFVIRTAIFFWCSASFECSTRYLKYSTYRKHFQLDFRDEKLSVLVAGP